MPKKLSLIENIFILLIFVFCFGSLSIMQGFPINYDLLHYHLYLPFAFLTGRINTDFAPCGILSFFNPVLDIPFYFMFKNWLNTTWVILFLSGIYCAILAFILFKVNIFFLKKTPLKGFFYPFAATVLGISDCIIIATFNTTCNDIQIAVLNFLAFFLLAKNLIIRDSHKRTLYISLSAFLVGISFGFKFNFYVIALFIIILCFYKILEKRHLFFKTIILFLIFSFVGFLISEGYFIFVFLNKMYNFLYMSVTDLTLSDLKPYLLKCFEPKVSNIFYINPFFWSINPKLVEVTEFFDLKHILFFISFWWLYIWFTINKAKSDLKLNYRLKILFIYIFISYILWINGICFVLLRYFFSTIVLSGTIIVLCFYTLFDIFKIKNNYIKKFIIIMVIIFSFLNYTMPDVEKTHQKITIPKLNTEEKSFVIFASKTLSFLILENPESEYTYIYKELFSCPHYTQYINDKIKTRKPVYIVAKKEDFAVIKDIEKFFNIKTDNCKKIDNLTQGKEFVDFHSSNIYLCKVFSTAAEKEQ